ncbi:MAG: L-seryl-tRNA(Sec) selenium transferase [Candidatus Marinimicrobia bacterium]|nr:L-seryl-tRNA(Sec) selenium transferase [Candidatus Neomarinimicrobiota bacterium]
MNSKDIIQNNLKNLPSVDLVLSQQVLAGLKLPHELILSEIQRLIAVERDKMMDDGETIEATKESLAKELAAEASKTLRRNYLPSLRKVINATGVILHTNLGRAPLSKSVAKRVSEIAGGYTNLEIDLESGKRSDRTLHIERLLTSLTGGESAAIVNNNAAAVLLSINSLAYKKECIVSRGQLVEIGGSFRMPDVMERAGTRMIEVGTTNRTHLKDFKNAVNDETGAIILVHTSNYKITGFTNFPSHSEIVNIAHENSIPVIYDLGSGALTDLSSFGLPPEELVSSVLKSGVDVVTFSGDKLLGGPQAGLLVGSTNVIKKCKENPMMRVLRCDKITLTAMEETLKLFADTESLSDNHAVYSLFSKTIEALTGRAEKIVADSEGKIDEEYTLEIVSVTGEAGSGSLPVAELPSMAIRIQSESKSMNKTAHNFRSLAVPVIGYIKENAFYLDMRTLLEEDIDLLSKSIKEVLGK